MVAADIGGWIHVGAVARLAVTGFRRRSETEPMRMLTLVRNTAVKPHEYVVTADFADADGNAIWGTNVVPGDGRTNPLSCNASVRMDWELPAVRFGATHAIFRFRNAETYEPIGNPIRVPIAPAR
jgi:hypothetical protein